MTCARALKQSFAPAPPEPGERYTTDRRHVLGSLQSRCPAEPRSAAEPAPAVRGISEARIIEKTGHGFAHWFDVLDRFGAVKRGHTAAARHLYEAHGVPGWHAQGITVAYERARGVRAVNQRCDGLYEVSVSKVVAADVAAIIKALATPRQRARLEVSDPDLMRALAAAVDAPASEGFVVRPDGLGRSATSGARRPCSSTSCRRPPARCPSS